MKRQRFQKQSAVALLAALFAAVIGLIGVSRTRARTAPPNTAQQEPSGPEFRPEGLSALQVIDLERVAKLLGGLGILLYILGLLNVNGYLFSFGVSDFSIIRTRFIYTGALIASSAFLCGLPLFILGPLRQEYKTGARKSINELAEREAKGAGGKGTLHRWRHRVLRGTVRLLLFILWCILVILVLLLPAFILHHLYLGQFSASDVELITGESSGATPGEAKLAAAIMVYGFGLLHAWNIQRGIRSLRRKAVKSSKDASRNIALDIGTEVGLALAVTALYCVVFMTFVYPVIPQQYGGGRPQQVSLLFEDDAMSGLKQLRVPMQQKGQQVSAPLALVHETDELYVVRLRDKRVLRIDRRLVSAVLNEEQG